MRRIEDKSSRQVTFSKRRGGLMKKARQLAVLCDCDIAVIIFSGRGKLYDFCSSNSLEQILEKYHRSCLDAEANLATGTCGTEESPSKSASFRTCEELLEMVQSYVEGSSLEHLSVADLMQLEEELGSALMQTRSRMTHLMTEYVRDLQEKERMIHEENEQLQIKIDEKNGDDVAVGLNNCEIAQINCASEAQKVTLPLFTTQ